MIAGFSILAIAVALLAALASAFVRGLAGFGMAILLVPVLGLAVTPAQAVVAANVLGLLIGLKDIRPSLANAEHTARYIAVLAAVATPPGLWLLAITEPPLARLLIALVALGAFAAFLLPQREPHPPSRGLTTATGIASGLFNGFAGMPGAPLAPYYLGRRIAPAVARASMMTVFMATSLAGVGSALVLRVADWRAFAMAALLFPAVVLGDWLGARAFGRISPVAWRVFTGVVLGSAAGGALVRLLNQ